MARTPMSMRGSATQAARAHKQGGKAKGSPVSSNRAPLEGFVPRQVKDSENGYKELPDLWRSYLEANFTAKAAK